MSNEMVIFSKNINKQSLVYPNMKDMPVLLIEGIFDGFELFPFDRCDWFIAEVPQYSVDTWNFFYYTISDLV